MTNIDDKFAPDIRSGGLRAAPVRYETLADSTGTISIGAGVVFLTRTTAGAYVLSDPASGMDGASIDFVNVGGAAHTVTYSGGFGEAAAGKDVATFVAQKDSGMRIIAKNQVWYAVNLESVSLA
jgi:hypothetical protein